MEVFIVSIILKIPAWLARTEKLTTILTGEVLRETPKALYIKGYAKIMPSQNCLRCGREITNPVSRVVGIGPECCAKLGIARPDYTKSVELQKQLEQSTAFERWFPKSQIEVEGTWELLPTPVDAVKELIGNRLCIEEKMIRVFTVPGNKELCKSVQGYKWNPDTKAWEYPIRVGIAKQLIEAFQSKGVQLTIDTSITDLLNEVVTVSNEATDKLFPYQLEGVKFMIQYKRCLLADDMGLGKTVQSIMAATQIGKKILVVCPASLKRNWQREFHFWTPEWKVQIIDGTPKQREDQMKSDAQVFICSWEMLRLGAKIENKHLSTRGPELTKLEKMKFDVCIMDEAHKIKNRKAIVTKCAADLAKFIPYVFPLTGTPMMNNPDDLYSILNVLAPTEFKSYWKFVEKYCTVVKDDYGYVVGGLKPGMDRPLKTLLEQLVLRRTKGEVLKELPVKMTQKFICPLEGKQAKIYKEMAEDMYTKWEGQVVSATVVIAQITRLKQIVIDPTLMMEEHDNNPLQGAKIDALLDIVEGLGDQKVVIFSQFAKACKRLKITLEGQGYTGVILTGDMNSKQRDDSVQSFQQDPKCKFIIVSTLAGGTGLTLTAASTAIFMDKYWTPAINIQAQDRLHRIGQRSSVNIIELLAENTVEDAIEELLKYKYEQFQSLFSTDEVVTNQTKVKTRDLMALFNKR